MPPRRTNSDESSDFRANGLPGEPPSTPGSGLQKYSKRPSNSTEAVAKRPVRRSRLSDPARRQGRGELPRDVVGAAPAASLSRRETRHTRCAPRDAAAVHEDPETKHDANNGATTAADECGKEADGKEEATNAGERTGGEGMDHDGAQTPGAGSFAAESSFLNETLTKVHSSKVWFVLLCQLADLKEPVPMESFNWGVKCAIMLLHMSKDEELSPWHLKSSAIHVLSEILQDEDYASKRKRLAHFIELFKFLMTCFSHLVAYSERKNPLAGIETASNCEAALPNAEATDTPDSVIQFAEVECSSAPRQTLNRGNSAQSVETVVSSAAVTLNPTDALLSDSPHSKSGDLENSAFSSAPSNQMSSASWSTPLLPFNWINSEGNDARPENWMNCPLRLSGLETHQEGFTTTTTDATTAKGDNTMNATLSPRVQPTTLYIQQNDGGGVLPIPETTSSFTNKLTPPKLTNSSSLSTPVLQQTSICQGRTMAFVRNNSATGILPPSNSSALSASDQEALNNVLLLVSGQHQFLVLPKNGLETRLMQLDESNTSTEASNKGTAIPLSVGPPPSDKHSLPIQEGSSSSSYRLQDPTTLPFIEPQCTKKRIRGDVTASQIKRLTDAKKLFCMSHFHRAQREKNQRLIKCLLTSGGRPRCSLFYISGFVDNDIWLRLPATIAITQFEDKTAFEQRSKQVKRLALKLDEQIPSSHAVPQLYEQKLVAIATLPGINLIVVPTYMEPHVFEIEVFVASTTAPRPVETPSSS